METWGNGTIDGLFHFWWSGNIFGRDNRDELAPPCVATKNKYRMLCSVRLSVLADKMPKGTFYLDDSAFLVRRAKIKAYYWLLSFFPKVFIARLGYLCLGAYTPLQIMDNPGHPTSANNSPCRHHDPIPISWSLRMWAPLRSVTRSEFHLAKSPMVSRSTEVYVT